MDLHCQLSLPSTREALKSLRKGDAWEEARIADVLGKQIPDVVLAGGPSGRWWAYWPSTLRSTCGFGSPAVSRAISCPARFER